VSFLSLASDLVPGDYNDASDMFVVRLGGADTDGDGMEDDWELAYFNTLTRDGAGDLDGDGVSDREEFRAGTDPTNRGSVFQVLTLSSASGGVRLLWSARPGGAYRVQAKGGLSDPGWSEVSGTVTAGGTTATWTDTAAGAEARFYRVVAQE
jgi:hypothetical protein